jgi:hypothetical protein
VVSALDLEERTSWIVDEHRMMDEFCARGRKADCVWLDRQQPPNLFKKLCPAIFGEEFEGATMTRIGRCQIKTRQLADNASYRRDDLAPLKISKPLRLV